MTETMKDSGQEWIGAIPESWDTNRIRYCLNEINVKNSPVKTEQILSLVKDKGVMLYEEKGDVGNKAKEDITGYKVAFPNTLIVNSMNILIGSVGVSKYKGCVSPVYYVFREKDNSDLRFVNYIFNTREFQKELRKYANGILEIRLRVSATDIFNRKIPLSPKEEQIKIADFLDEKCAEIDKLSEDIQKQIDILNNYKKSVITRAVTKGLDPNAEMKDSGVQWIGLMPSHWAINRGKFILKYLQKPTRETDGVITCFRDGEVTLRSNRREEGFTMADKEIGYQGIDIGDLVVHGMDGFAGAIGISDSRGKASPVINVLDTAMDKKYIMYYLRSMAYSDVFLNLATGIRVRSCDLRWNKLANLEYPIPPVEEQKKISSYIENVLEATNKTILTEKYLYERLQDYKKSIIYEYVTGKKRVKGAL